MKTVSKFKRPNGDQSFTAQNVMEKKKQKLQKTSNFFVLGGLRSLSHTILAVVIEDVYTILRLILFFGSDA